MEDSEKKKIFRSIFYPFLFVAILWMVHVTESLLDTDFIRFGLYPRVYSGLIGILTSPLIHEHADHWWASSHLWSNSFPLIVLGSITFYFYRPLAFSVFFWVYLMSGIWLWAAGRDAYHIGASGLVYGFASFLFFSGIFRKERSLMVLSLLVVFLYGGLIWGIFPVQPKISWESHLLGGLAGIITSYYFRKEGPQAKKIEWNDDDVDENGEWRIEQQDLYEERNKDS